MSNKAVSSRSIRPHSSRPAVQSAIWRRGEARIPHKNSRHAADSRGTFRDRNCRRRRGAGALRMAAHNRFARRAAASRRPCGTGVGRGLGITLCPPESLPCWRSSGIGRQTNVARFHPQNPRRSRCAQAATGSQIARRFSRTAGHETRTETMNDLPFPRRFPWLPAMAILAFSGALFLCNWLVWTPMQRYYLGSYLRCALFGTDPAAGTEVRWLYKTAPHKQTGIGYGCRRGSGNCGRRPWNPDAAFASGAAGRLDRPATGAG